MSEPTAYSTTNPDTIAAFRAAVTAQREFAHRIVADATALGKNKGALRSSDVFGGHTAIGLAPDDPDDPPAGWTYVKGRDRLEPKRGVAGDAARQWLTDHQPPAETDVRGILEDHGLPRNDRLGGRGGTQFRINVPELFEHGDELWALYRGEPAHWSGQGDGCAWTTRRLSEYYAAREALSAAEAVAP